MITRLTPDQARLVRHMGAGHPLWRRPEGTGACCGFTYTAPSLDALADRGIIKPFNGAVGPWVLTQAAREEWCAGQQGETALA